MRQRYHGENLEAALLQVDDPEDRARLIDEAFKLLVHRAVSEDRPERPEREQPA